MEERGETSSVGRALSADNNLSSVHPLYLALTNQVEMKVAEYAAERGQARSVAPLAFLTVALDNEQVNLLAAMYPEFRQVLYPMHRPAHSLFVQARRLAVDWMFLQASRIAPSAVACLGLPLLSALQSKLRVTMVCDSASVVAGHERHAVNMDAYRLYSDISTVSGDIGRLFSREPYDRYLNGGGPVLSAEWDEVEADVLCVDGMMSCYSPVQVAVAMGSSGADVAYGTFPYHHSMLLNDVGELPGFGISYERTSTAVNFRYPEGVAGVASYPYDVWRSWLVSHAFSVGSRASAMWFQLELMKVRGCIMFYRMIRLPARPADVPVVHALDLDTAKGKYLVTSMRLNGVAANPHDMSSWSERRYLVSKRLVDRVYQFAMQLPRESFTRYAIRKQLHAVNDRLVVEGTTVRVNPSLDGETVDALVSDLYSRAYVDRYDAGELTLEARKYVDGQVAFATYSRAEKLWFIATACAVAAWDATVGAMNSWVRQAADAVRRFMVTNVPLGAANFQMAPSYLLVGGSSLADLTGGQAVAREVTRRAALESVGVFADVARVCAGVAEIASGAFRVDTFAAFATPAAVGSAVDAVVDMVRALNPVDESPFVRRQVEIVSAVRAACSERRQQFNPVADPVYLLNEFHSASLPGVAEQDLEHDTASVSLDPQDRTLMASYLKLPKYFGDPPKSRMYYRSRLRALGTPKRQQTLQELLSAIAARNLNAPQVSLPQGDSEVASLVWENFLRRACVPDAREKLRRYQADVVGIEEEALREWASQSTPEKLEAVRKELEEESLSLAEMPVHEYLAQLKSDFKPTLSVKPIYARTEPQVIVYHKKALSALYSSMFRVLVRRFLSLLKPNYHVNLLKDVGDIRDFIAGVHPFDEDSLKYFENDFSKYDKSQGQFVFVLEELVFRQLGLDQTFLERWVAGHVKCSIRAVSVGLSLHVMYQRKSGDATTSFGNVLLNVLSVTYAYGSADVVWALFMGDDSLVCARHVGHESHAVAVLAEVFNLGAKFYMTKSPYFASNFVLIDPFSRCVALVPDPVKRVERFSMSVAAENPQWQERFVSAGDSLAVYMNCMKTAGLGNALHERYFVSEEWTRGVADAIATLITDFTSFRSIWEDKPEISLY